MKTSVKVFKKAFMKTSVKVFKKAFMKTSIKVPVSFKTE